jgi:Raf kinase inhibitor-like YbhB/YbcL family protein
MLTKTISIAALALVAASCASMGPTGAQAEALTLTSPDIAEGQPLDNAQVYAGFGCEGGNVSPELAWSDAPAGTRSFALTAYDPDAPTGSGWWHWSVVNIPASARSIPAAASRTEDIPDGAVELENDFGAIGFGGACPPPGEMHRYEFTIHALSTPELELPDGASNALAGFMINANTIESARITAVYTR